MPSLYKSYCVYSKGESNTIKIIATFPIKTETKRMQRSNERLMGRLQKIRDMGNIMSQSVLMDESCNEKHVITNYYRGLKNKEHPALNNQN